MSTHILCYCRELTKTLTLNYHLNQATLYVIFFDVGDDIYTALKNKLDLAECIKSNGCGSKAISHPTNSHVLTE